MSDAGCSRLTVAPLIKPRPRRGRALDRDTVEIGLTWRRTLYPCVFAGMLTPSAIYATLVDARVYYAR